MQRLPYPSNCVLLSSPLCTYIHSRFDSSYKAVCGEKDTAMRTHTHKHTLSVMCIRLSSFPIFAQAAMSASSTQQLFCSVYWFCQKNTHTFLHTVLSSSGICMQIWFEKRFMHLANVCSQQEQVKINTHNNCYRSCGEEFSFQRNNMLSSMKLLHFFSNKILFHDIWSQYLFVSRAFWLDFTNCSDSLGALNWSFFLVWMLIWFGSHFTVDNLPSLLISNGRRDLFAGDVDTIRIDIQTHFMNFISLNTWQVHLCCFPGSICLCYNKASSVFHRHTETQAFLFDLYHVTVCSHLFIGRVVLMKLYERALRCAVWCLS